MKQDRKNQSQDQVPVGLEIGDIAFGGKGVGRVDGRVWFVPFTLPGERVLAKPRKVKKDFVEADLVSVETTSPRRVTPECPYYGVCGGCRYQHAEYSLQLEIKQKQIAALLRRIGHLPDVEVEPVRPSESVYGYRNRITVHIQNGVTGFHRADGGGLMDIAECKLAEPEVNAKLKAFRGKAVFDGHRTLRTFFDPAGFRQTNDSMANLLGEHIMELLTEGGDLLIDAYCGAGFFAKKLRDRFVKVIGIDWSEAAITAANRSVGENESYLDVDVAEGLQAVFHENPHRKTVLLLDPPEEGLDPAIIEILKTRQCCPLIYVSCNPATFSRDAAKFRDHYRLVRVTPFDMFPQTAEVEVVGIFEPLA